MAERRQDEQTRERLDQIEAGYKKLAARNFAKIEQVHRALRAVQLLVALLLLAHLGAWWVTGTLLNDNSKRIRDVQIERRDVAFSNCQQQDERNIATVRQLDREIARAEHRQPARRAEIENSRQATIGLINALVPVRDCNALANAVLHKPPSPS